MKRVKKRSCIICKQPTKRSTTKFCNIKCRAQWQKGRRIGGPTKILKPIECRLCRELFSPTRSSTKFCSRKCSGKFNIGNCIAKGFTSKGLKRTEKQRRLLSEKAKQRIGVLNGMYGKKAAHGKGCWHETWEKNKVFLRSSWELLYARYLDRNKIGYLVEAKAFPVEYLYKEQVKQGTYRPDFYLYNDNKFIEIKGWWREDAEAKFLAFKTQYPFINIDLLTKKELTELGVLNVL